MTRDVSRDWSSYQSESLALLSKESPPTSYRVTIDVTDQTLFEISSKYATSRN